jgi:hypothetical protein
MSMKRITTLIAENRAKVSVSVDVLGTVRDA